jgi:hypothetical protein
MQSVLIGQLHVEASIGSPTLSHTLPWPAFRRLVDLVQGRKALSVRNGKPQLLLDVKLGYCTFHSFLRQYSVILLLAVVSSFLFQPPSGLR